MSQPGHAVDLFKDANAMAVQKAGTLLGEAEIPIVLKENLKAVPRYE